LRKQARLPAREEKGIRTEVSTNLCDRCPFPAIAELIWASPLSWICWRCMMPGEGLCGCACLARWEDFYAHVPRSIRTKNLRVTAGPVTMRGNARDQSGRLTFARSSLGIRRSSRMDSARGTARALAKSILQLFLLLLLRNFVSFPQCILSLCPLLAGTFAILCRSQVV